METSAKMSVNVEEAFNKVLKKVIDDMDAKEKNKDDEIQKRANQSISRLEVPKQEKKGCC